MDWEAFYNHFREPDFIPGYEIQNRLGGGAFGEVYKSRKHSIGKPYAIKFLKVDDEVQREAIERELEQVRHFAAIDHPNLVTIEDMGTVREVPYLIMGYAGEDTLARRLREGTLDPRTALLFFVQACRGVLALHDRRLVHFDLKPSNIFIKGDIARVGDYGLSKLMVDGRMTLSFGRGTPQYMAPEMIRSRADHRADVYSLGVILFESLTGELPFQSDTPGTIVLREEDRPPTFPSDFPASLRKVVERCLRLDPQDRYGSVSELLEDLGQTARPGDSVRLERVPAAATANPARPSFAPHGARAAVGAEAARAAGRAGPEPEPEAAGAATSTGAAPETPSGANEELRQTASELARGAVEVARSVWQGLRRNEPESGSGAATAPEDAARREAREAPPATGNGVASGGAPGAGASAPYPMLTLSDRPLGDRSSPEPTASPGPDADDTVRITGASAVAGEGAAAVTIPVPPRVGGGVLGTVWATLVLALEVLVSLVIGLMRQVFRGFGRAGDKFLRSSGSITGRLVRLFLFLLILALAGAAVTLMAVIVLQSV